MQRYIIGVLGLITAVLWLSVFSIDDKLHIIACDVGQGDAILITFKSTQILTDGGPNNKVVECLERYMPFYDRTIELVILTHPDADHVTGLVEVFKRYNIDNFLENNLEVGTQVYKALDTQVRTKGVNVIRPLEGMKIRLGLMYLDILNPLDKNKIQKTNDLSIVYMLTYGHFNGLFTGDIGPEVSDVLSRGDNLKKVNYLKVPHHGSKNGLTSALLDVANPEIAVISVGKGNRYGHPHQEILEMLKNSNAKILRTDQEGDIEVVTDGVGYWIKD